MIDPAIGPDSPVVYLTHLSTGPTWISGTFEAFVTPGRTRLTDSVIVIPTDQRALNEQHHRGAIEAQYIYAVPEALILGQLNPYQALHHLLATPDHAQRELHKSQILDALDAIAEHYVVTL